MSASDADLIPPTFDEVKDCALKNIETLCNRLLPTGRKQGNSWVARVPWRYDNTPSLSVLLDKACWQDFGRPGDGGSMIDLVMQIDGCDAIEARRRLAITLGMQFTKPEKPAAGAIAKPKKVTIAPPPVNLTGWQADYIVNPKGIPKALFANCVLLLRNSFTRYPLRFDTFAQRAMLGTDLLQDTHLREITEWVQGQGVEVSSTIVAEAVARVSEETAFNPVREYLEIQEWDAIPRLDHFLIEHAGAEDTPLNRAISSKWMIQAVARVFQPGCIADATLVLEGPQGIGKSTLFRELFGDLWFTDHLPDLTSKDALLQLKGVWCVEVAELSSLSRHDSAKVKQFLTSRIDRYRDPYGRLVSDYPRTCVFAGTVNPGAIGWLKDETGARRFWPVAVGEVDVDSIRVIREQLWAEARTRYEAGEPWHLSTTSLTEAAAEAQAERYEGDPWDDQIQGFVAGKSEVTTADILSFAINLTATGDWSRAEQMRVGRCMSQLGWTRKRKRVPTGLAWVYVSPPPREPKLDF